MATGGSHSHTIKAIQKVCSKTKVEVPACTHAPHKVGELNCLRVMLCI